MPKKTVLVQYLGPRLGLSRDRLSALLLEGRDRFWTETRVTRGQFPGTRAIIYRPLPLKTRKTRRAEWIREKGKEVCFKGSWGSMRR